MTPPPPKGNQILSQFSDDFCSRQPHPQLDVTLHDMHLYGRLYLVLSNVAFLLHQHIKHFTTNRALSPPKYLSGVNQFPDYPTMMFQKERAVKHKASRLSTGGLKT